MWFIQLLKSFNRMLLHSFLQLSWQGCNSWQVYFLSLVPPVFLPCCHINMNANYYKGDPNAWMYAWNFRRLVLVFLIIPHLFLNLKRPLGISLISQLKRGSWANVQILSTCLLPSSLTSWKLCLSHSCLFVNPSQVELEDKPLNSFSQAVLPFTSMVLKLRYLRNGFWLCPPKTNGSKSL